MSFVLSGATQDAAAVPRDPLATLRTEAERIAGLVECRGTRAFLAATNALPAVEPRTVLYDAKAREAVTPEQHTRLATAEQARFQPTEYGPEFYYTTRYGSPLAYARALEVLGRAVGPATDALSGKRILDFGYGGIGHLRMLASLGCDVVGVDVDSLLHAYYQPEDQGEVASASSGKPGRLALVHGRWPAEAAAKAAVGDGYDLVLSKNVLKQGYVRPAQEVDPRLLVDLGVPPEAFLAEVARILKPGGHLLIYNLCPAPKPDRYLPWAYGESPFTRAELQGAGFELLAFDVEDHAAARELGFALGWEQQGMDLEGDLFAWYTLARRKG
ncbi:MAG TPA: hypothetical protein VF530_17435 [Planctomycetota bacterium]